MREILNAVIFKMHRVERTPNPYGAKLIAYFDLELEDSFSGATLLRINGCGLFMQPRHDHRRPAQARGPRGRPAVDPLCR